MDSRGRAAHACALGAGIPPRSRSGVVLRAVGAVCGAAGGEISDRKQRKALSNDRGSLMVERTILVRAAALYVPIMVTAVLCLRQPPNRRQVAGMLLAFSWNLSALLWLESINLRAHFWNYHARGG